MDFFTYSTLQKKYDSFEDPVAQIVINEFDLKDDRSGITVSDIEVDMTCGFDAGQAGFSLFDCYDFIGTRFKYEAIKSYIALGSSVKISLGYNMKAREVFRGVIVRVDFVVDDYSAPHVRITAMDVKAVMMANHYHKKLMADTYSAAVKEVFSQNKYMSMISPTGVITKLDISATPDTLDVTDAVDTDKSIEMVGESDYEFVVRAAKKYNYEFYCLGGQVIFRPARGDVTVLLTLSNQTRIFNMNVSYDVTGLVNSVTVRGLDVGRASVQESTKIHKLKVSTKPMARSLFSGSEYVYVDPTVTSKIEASRRADYIYDTMSYKFGSLDMEIMGIPEIVPGRFIELQDFGGVINNVFYVTAVHHKLDTTGRYTSRVVGQVNSLPMMTL